MEDAQAVMDAVSSDRAVVFGYSEGAPMSILFAATYPEKVSALILGSAFARWFPAPDYPCGPGAEAVYAAHGGDRQAPLGPGRTIEWFLPSRAGSPEARQALARFERMAISPSAFLRMLADDPRNRRTRRAARDPRADARDPAPRRPDQPALPRTLPRIAHRRRPLLRAARRPRPAVRRSEELDLFAEIEDFLAATPPRPNRPASSPRSCSPRGWRRRSLQTSASTAAVCDEHRRQHPGHFRRPRPSNPLRAAIRRPAATTAARRVLASTPAKSTSPATASPASPSQIAGVARTPSAGEILVSRTVKDLVVGSGISFTDRGSHPLAATDDHWPLFAVPQPDYPVRATRSKRSARSEGPHHEFGALAARPRFHVREGPPAEWRARNNGSGRARPKRRLTPTEAASPLLAGSRARGACNLRASA